MDKKISILQLLIIVYSFEYGLFLIFCYINLMFFISHSVALDKGLYHYKIISMNIIFDTHFNKLH